MSGDAAVPIYFRCDGGREDGLGHLSRCLALADWLAAEAGVKPVFLTHAPDGLGQGFIESRGHDCLLSPALAGGDEDLGFVLDELSRGAERPILVIDSRRIGPDYVSACRDRGAVACLDDESLRDLPCDLLINGHVWVSAESYPARAARRVLAGADYNLIPPSLFAAESQSAATADPLHVLITLGGEDPHNHTAWVVESCADLLIGLGTTIVIGPAHPTPATTKHMAQASLPRARVIESPPSLAPYIAEADLAITAGGITCYELAAARVPQLAIMVEEHQQPLVEALERHGCLLSLGSYADLPRDAARETLQRLIQSTEARSALSQAAAALFPSSGLSRVGEAILNTGI